MSARGLNFLEIWLEENVPAHPGDWVEAMKLADKLRIDTAAASLKLSDLELEDHQLENYILDAMVITPTATQGD